MTVISVNIHAGRRDLVALFALLVIGTGVPLWLAAAAGAIGIPTSDDWVYSQGADSLFRTGTINMPLHTAASIGQLVMVQPLLWLSRGDTWAFTAFGLAMMSLGIVCAYLLARRFVGTGFAMMVVLLVAVFPGLARESASFMTDVPCFALIMLCLLQGVRWLDRAGSRFTLATSLAAGLLAVSIREFAIAAPAAVLLAAWARSRPEERAWLGGATAAFAVGVGSVLVVAASIPGREASAPRLEGFLFIGPALATFAAVLLPALALGVGRRLATFRPESIVLGAGFVCVGLLVPWGWLAGNIWMQTGFAGDLLLSGTRGDVIDAGAWALSRQVATFAAILLAAAAVVWTQRNLGSARSIVGAFAAAIRIVRSREGLLVVFLLAYAAELVGFAPFFIYDRYVIPMVPIAAVLLLRGRPQTSRLGRSLALAHGSLAWLAISAILISANSFAYDVARWREGDATVREGYNARTVDAGYEWIGYHARGVVKSGAPAGNMDWSGSRWALVDSCAVLSNSPLDDAALTLIHVNPIAYRTYLFFGPPKPLYRYGAATVGCPLLPPAFHPG
jgi:hypothetical protein